MNVVSTVVVVWEYWSRFDHLQAFASGTERTMVTLDASVQHRLDNYYKSLSFSDVKLVNKMLKCEGDTVLGKSIVLKKYQIIQK